MSGSGQTDSVAGALATLRASTVQVAPAGVRANHEELLRSFAAQLESQEVPAVGDAFPEFALPDQVGAPIISRDVLRRGGFLLLFYRGLWCPFCQLRLRSLQRMIPFLKKKDLSVLAVSPQNPDDSLSTAEKLMLEFSVLSDSGNRLAESCGIMVTVPQELRGHFDNSSAEYREVYGNESYSLPCPAAFIVDGSGTVRWAAVSADFTGDLGMDSIREIVDSLYGT